MEKILSILNKFFKSKTGFIFMFFVVLPVFALSTLAVTGSTKSQPVTKSSVVQKATVAEIQKAYSDIFGRPASDIEIKNHSDQSIEAVRVNLMSSAERKELEARDSTSAVTPKSTSAATKVYIASVCAVTPIPYKTVYVESPHYDKGEILPWGGVDGYINACTADSNGKKPADIIIPALDKTITIGTGPAQIDKDTTSTTNTTTQETGNSRDARIAECVSQVQSTFQVANSTGSSAYTYALQRCYSIQ